MLIRLALPELFRVRSFARPLSHLISSPDFRRFYHLSSVSSGPAPAAAWLLVFKKLPPRGAVLWGFHGSSGRWFRITVSDIISPVRAPGGDLAVTDLRGAQELRADLRSYQSTLPGTGQRTLPNDVLSSNASSDREFFFQRWFISLRASFLKILTDVLGILNAHSSAPKDIPHHESSSVAIENNQVLVALTICSLRLIDLAKSYDLLAASHGDMVHESFTTIARLAFMCSLLSFCTAFSVDFSNVPGSSEPCRVMFIPWNLIESLSMNQVLDAHWGVLDDEDVVVWFSTDYITIKDMVVTGMPIKIVGVAALTVLLPTLDIVKEKEVPKRDGSNKFDSKEFILK
ncbi:hypothetical protein D1007_60662 [Hordeum vulgare]|nr:hypothetical protein D1007_60662 [Hordeum vulgare]